MISRRQPSAKLCEGPRELAQFWPGPNPANRSSLDVAIDGDALLVVQTAAGERYTRYGALQISPAGALVTSAGDPVVGIRAPIQFQNTDHDISIGVAGTITVREGASAISDSTRGQLQLAHFDKAVQLQKLGGDFGTNSIKDIRRASAFLSCPFRPAAWPPVRSTSERSESNNSNQSLRKQYQYQPVDKVALQAGMTDGARYREF